jgi:hypothetical protein
LQFSEAFENKPDVGLDLGRLLRKLPRLGLLESILLHQFRPEFSEKKNFNGAKYL